MNNKIETHYVDLNTAKWLKEKGFDVECRMCVEDGDERPLPFDCGTTLHRNSIHPYYSAPEQLYVVEWLRINYCIWISVSVEDNKWFYGIKKIMYQYDVLSNIEPYNSPQEAYSAAFNCIRLNNLI